MKQALLFFISIVLGTQIFAQTTKPEIVTDRPDQTEAPSLVPTGGIQVELGTAIETDVIENTKVTNYTYATALVKYGINKNFELRLISEYLGQRAKFNESNIKQNQWCKPIGVGSKNQNSRREKVLAASRFYRAHQS